MAGASFQVDVHVGSLKRDFLNFVYSQQNRSNVTEISANVHTQRSYIPMKSPVSTWARQANQMAWDDVDTGWTMMDLGIECDLGKFHLPNLVDRSYLNQVLLLQAPTGAGKSLIGPAIAFKVMHRAYHNDALGRFPKNHGFHAIHTVPTAEQVVQNSDHVRWSYHHGGIEIGDYSSALSRRRRSAGANTRENILYPGYTHYVFMTQFFGLHAMNSSSVIDFIIIDEIHELTPKVIELLNMVRDMLREGRCFRVLLLSATMSDRIVTRLSSYFGMFTFEHVTCGQSPFPVVTEIPGNDQSSQEAFLDSDQSYVDADVYRNEALGDQAESPPDETRLRNRAISFAKILTRRFANRVNIPQGFGSLVFLPGASDTIQCFNDFSIWRDQNNFNFAVAMKITGENRADLPMLQTEPEKEDMRMVFSTPLLATGVTLIGINTVVDTGTAKIPSNHDRRGVTRLVCNWQDHNSLMQRRGRVGRKGNGTFYPAYSKDRMAFMLGQDNTLKYCNSKYINSDLPIILYDSGSLLFCPSMEVFYEIVLETGILGFFRTNVRGYDLVTDYHIDSVGTVLSKAFCGVPLELGLFIIQCYNYGVLLPGLLWVAAEQTRHNAFVRPRRGDNSRDSPRLSINWWPTHSQCRERSDLIVYLHMLWNAFFAHTDARLLLPNPWAEHSPPQILVNGINAEGLEEVYIAFCALITGCKCLGIISNVQEVFTYARSGLVLKDCTSNGAFFRVLDLDPYTYHLLSVALTSTHGHRVLKQADFQHDNHGFTRTNYYLKGSVGGKGDPFRFIVQGERMGKSRDGHLAVYQSIFVHKPADQNQRLVTHLHQIDPVEFLLHGNNYGCMSDQVFTDHRMCLLIQTNTLLMEFRFRPEDKDLLLGIAEFRKMQKLMPGARFTRDRNYIQYINRISDFIADFDYTGGITATLIPGEEPPRRKYLKNPLLFFPPSVRQALENTMRQDNPDVHAKYFS